MTWTIERHDEIDSTQARAVELAAAGAPEGTVVVAAVQTAGRGRYGHSWASPRGGLWASALVDSGADGRQGLLAVSIAAALAARAAIARAAGLETRLKWPNDILSGRRKLGGVIATERGERIAIGVGIDANFRRAELPPDVRAIATTIIEETGAAADLDALLDALLDELGPRLDRWRAADASLREEAWAALVREHPVRWTGPPVEGRLVDLGSGAPRPGPPVPVRGVAEGRIAALERSGALVIEDASGRHETIVAGDLEVLWPK